MIGRVIGLGQRTAGDDGVGLAILDHLRARAVPGIQLVEAIEPCASIPLLATPVPVVFVDAVVTGGIPGGVLQLDPDALPDEVRPVSTHGVGLVQALEIARLLADPARSPAWIKIVGVTITTMLRGAGLSSPVEAAVPRAVDAVLRLLTRGDAVGPRGAERPPPRATHGVPRPRSSTAPHRPRRH